MRFALLALATTFLTLACRGSSEPDTGKQHGEPFLRCAQPYDDGVSEKFRLPPLTIERQGHDLRIHGIKRGLIVFGLLAGITEPSAANLKNIDYFLEQFRAAGAQALIVAGGVGTTQEHIDKILAHLARAPVPVLVCPGAQEHLGIFRHAVAEKRQKSPQLLDMTQVRRVRIGNVSVVSIPGYHKPFYLSAGKNGCAYEEEDLEKTAGLFEKNRTTVVLSPSPPRGNGEHAVDRSRGGVNIGDATLARMLGAAGVRFGLFGYVHESGGHATLDDGFSAARPGVWHESLFTQAGAAEAIPISLVGEGRAVGMAQIVEFSGNRARFRTIAAPFDGR